MKEIEVEFRKATKILLGNELSDLESYAEWLGKRVPLPIKGKSAISNKEVWAPPSLNFLKRPVNMNKLFSLDEMQNLEQPRFKAEDLEDKNIREIGDMVKQIAFVCGNFRYQECENVENSSGAGGGRNLYHCEDVFLNTKNIAYANYALYCENSFGCKSIINSSFCIHVYNSSSITRCFEVDCCSNSSDLLFCHNCENVRDSMFCFNAKNLKNAIGNVQLKPDEYKRIKSMFLKEIYERLVKDKDLDFDIFNLGD